MKKKLLPALIVTGLIILVVIIMGITALINKYTPTKKTEDLKEYFNISSDDEAALIVDNELSDYKAKIIDKKIYVDYKFVHDSLNSRFYWDANENVLHPGIFFFKIVGVVGGDQRNACFPGKPHKQGQHRALLVQPMVLYLNIIVSFAEQIFIVPRKILGFFIIPCQ